MSNTPITIWIDADTGLVDYIHNVEIKKDNKPDIDICEQHEGSTLITVAPTLENMRHCKDIFSVLLKHAFPHEKHMLDICIELAEKQFKHARITTAKQVDEIWKPVHMRLTRAHNNRSYRASTVLNALLKSKRWPERAQKLTQTAHDSAQSAISRHSYILVLLNEAQNLGLDIDYDLNDQAEYLNELARQAAAPIAKNLKTNNITTLEIYQAAAAIDGLETNTNYLMYILNTKLR